MQVNIEVKSGEIAEKTVRGKDGREYLIRDQVGWVDLGKAYPQEIKIPVEKGKEPYKPGKFVMDSACLYVDRYGTLSLGRLKLIAAK